MTAVRTGGDWTLDLARTGIRRLSAPQRAIGYIGWTFAENLGDDAMFEAAQALLPGRRLETFRGARREGVLARFGLSGRHSFSRIFLGGGTLINLGYVGVVRRALEFGVPVRTLGTGVGSSGFGTASDPPLENWLELLSRFDRVGVRGPRSLKQLQAIGIQNAEVVGDLALALTPDAPLVSHDSSRFLLNVAAPMRADPQFPSEIVLAELAGAARRLMDLGLEPDPVAFCEDDIAPLEAVMDKAGVTAGIARPRTAEAYFELARHARISLGVRLHCAVLSVCAGLAPLSLAYRGKGNDFAASVGLEDWMVEPAAAGLAERAATLADAAPEVGAKAHAAALRLRETLKRYVADA